MANGFNIGLENERGIILALRQVGVRADKAGAKGLQRAGTLIVAEAQNNLRTGVHAGSMTINATGRLSSSGKTQVLPNGDVEAGFFSKGNDKGIGYAAAVEYGRRAGKMPPVDYIEQWLKKKTSVRPGIKSAFSSAARFAGTTVQKYRRAIAWAIAKNIGRYGTKPHPFFEPAVTKTQGRLSQEVANEIKRIIESKYV